MSPETGYYDVRPAEYFCCRSVLDDSLIRYKRDIRPELQQQLREAVEQARIKKQREAILNS